MREQQLEVAAQRELIALTQPRPLPPALPREVPAVGVRLAKLAAHDGAPGEPGVLRWQRRAAWAPFFAGVGLLVASIALPLTGLGWLGGLAGLGGSLVVTLVALGWLARRAASRLTDRERRLLATVATRPFPVRCYLIWLTADRPLFDLHLRGPVDRAGTAAALRAISPTAELRWVDEAIARIALPAIPVGGGHGGDPVLLRRFFEEVAGPLHREVGISRVEMGGTVERS
jgi:hypothetical protein